MTFLKSLIYPLFILLLTACPNVPDNHEYEFEYETIIKETPVNLEGINSERDDYNSDLFPFPWFPYGIYFSSNRASGQDYDIIQKHLIISYHYEDDVLDVHTTIPREPGIYETSLLHLINTYDDQLGPLFFIGPDVYDYFFYADNRDGDFDIWYTYNDKSFGSRGSDDVIHGPDTLMAAQSAKDDLYPSFTEDQSNLFFCSNREDDLFNIYSIQLPGADSLHGFFAGTEPGEPLLNTVLSSDYNDKCPYIYKDVMVFTSDREGGQGGFDLYYSILVDGEWTAPVNFGPEINTEYDEYRPILFSFENLFSHLMIFSSDRPGGLGGFDLYMVIADGIIK
jgi:hypothetical protein